MSKYEDTYRSALDAVRVALNALADVKYDEAKANSPKARGENYDSDEDSRTTGVFLGLCEAHGLVCDMLRDYYRTQRAASALTAEVSR